MALLWKNLDQLLRQYQPYVALATEHPSAEESLLLDYVRVPSCFFPPLISDTIVFPQLVLK